MARSNQRDPDDHHFDIHASVVFQLGEDLITDVVQALIELVKNSYDADADYAKIVVATDRDNDFPDTYYPDARGFVVVEDNGSGMNEATINRGWLTISNSLKREMKRAQRTSPRGRTPLGDKGLGRLGVQRLGYNVEIFTKPKDEDIEYHVGWSWRDFEGENTLGNVEVKFDSAPSRRRSGTKLVISDLKDADYWRTQSTFEEFEQRLSQLVSPYRIFQDFAITATVNGKELEPAEITERVRRLAQVRYKIDFDGEKLSLRGRAALSFLRPQEKEAIAAFETLIESDEGERFFAFLSQRRNAAPFNLRRAKGGPWFVSFSQETPFTDIPGLRWIDVPGTNGNGSAPKKVPASPGSFHAEVDAFDLGRQTSAEQNAFNSAAEYRKFIKTLHGVRIFRDGFGVRVDQDWMGLAKQWTNAPSYYGLKPENTMGYVALTARHNQCLIETTDREGFKSTPHYENFLSLFAVFVRFAHDAQELLRRGWNDFAKEHQREVAAVRKSETPEDLHRQLQAGLAQASSLRDPLSIVQASLAEVSRSATRTLERVGSSSSSRAELKQLKALAGSVERQLTDAQGLLVSVAQFVEEASRLREISVVLQHDTQALREQMEEAYEVVSLGLTAEALSHEIQNVADQMAKRTQDLSRHLTKARISDARILGYIEYIKGSVAALRKQMAHLAPSLKYVREKRESIDLASFLGASREYYQLRWGDESIRLQIKIREPLQISINRGKLTQIFDNLVLNSEYWVREELRIGRIEEGIITVVISSPVVQIFDNGPGVDSVVETTLFDPFISRKPKRKGRGLGLFIVRQLLDTEGCSITLSPRRNERGRLYRFQIDFSGAVDRSE